MKFLPLGRWKGTLTKEDLPVNYIAISDHLDMVGVQLMATHTQTRKCNGDNLQNRVSTTIGPWRGGKFMPLTQRGHSVNTYCLSKIWFKSASVDMRVLDITKITSLVKSWIYADQLEKPEELVLYRSRKHGGLNVYNVKLRAMAELIKSFMDTAVNSKFSSCASLSAFLLSLMSCLTWFIVSHKKMTLPLMNRRKTLLSIWLLSKRMLRKVMEIRQISH